VSKMLFCSLCTCGEPILLYRSRRRGQFPPQCSSEKSLPIWERVATPQSTSNDHLTDRYRKMQKKRMHIRTDLLCGRWQNLAIIASSLGIATLNSVRVKKPTISEEKRTHKSKFYKTEISNIRAVYLSVRPPTCTTHTCTAAPLPCCSCENARESNELDRCTVCCAGGSRG
jgi:hypothetical protein